ncbi:TetR/AcrR family transcriptional regulator [Aquihabitans sp. G128]|uniref:TetR/AcrR family transcriptional regulator n=1 Tax=Aquihabitans sp. G128 TaxID=2849779 RepID=UPI001C246F2F|nr:TetR/AcrR family transcriptional regulator [Aquihabitans sp. G128]QXC59540.1 TetR/AcrR family transcriptional regulator [Aquihabitans sp. G128]
MSRRDEILEVAKVHIAERGYANSSMRDLAEAAGLLAGSLYSHFKSKAELVRDIVIHFYDELLPAQEAVIAAGGTGADQFAAMLRAVHAVCSRHREELTILHYDWHTLSQLDELADVHAQSLRTLDLWKAVIQTGQADGSIRASVDAESLVRIATSSIHALIDTVRYTTHPLPAERSAESAALLQEVLLTGITTTSTKAAARKPAAKRRQPVTATGSD